MGFVSRFLHRHAPASLVTPTQFDIQNRYEAEGGAAGLAGKKREDCPYDREQNSVGWNFWVYGCENAQGELRFLKEGYPTFTLSTAPISDEKLKELYALPRMPAEEAIRSGRWKPRYVRLPYSSLTTIAKSSS